MRLKVLASVFLVVAIPVLCQGQTTQGLTTDNTTSTAPVSSSAITNPPETSGTAATSTTTATTASTSTTVSTTTLTPEQDCRQRNASCEKCVSNAKCLYCFSDKSCKLYPAGKVLPPSSLCALDEARWGVCWLNFEALIISVSVIGGVLIITTLCCIYCCCCRGHGKSSFDKEDAKFESQRMERKNKQDVRRAERQTRLDEIRKKYGLMKDTNPYQQFDS